MNVSEDQNQALHDLFESYLEGTISPGDFDRLEALIPSDAEVRRKYVEAMDLHASLDRQVSVFLEKPLAGAASHIAISPNASLTIPSSTTKVFGWHGFGGYRPATLFGAGFAMASTVLIALFMRSFWLSSGPEQDTPSSPEYVATLISTHHCLWSDEVTLQHPGDQLRPGRLRLVEGVAELVFFRGARVTLTGPVVFDLISENHGALRQGQLTADVPDSAHGFTIETPGGKVIDYGTEFALMINDSGDADVNVIKGKVEVVGNTPASSKMLLTGDVQLFHVQGKKPLINLAVEPNAEAFAADVIQTFHDRHQIAEVNDGIYGNESSWIGGVDSRFIAIRLPGLCLIKGVAFGRDNTGEASDRWSGHYELQYTTVALPGLNTPDEQWETIRTWDYTSGWPDRTPAIRHRYDFAAVQATAVRLMVPLTGNYGGTAIDELEVYGTLPDDTVE